MESKIAWIGRLTGPKGELAQRIMQQLAPRFPAVEFTVVGGPLTDEIRTAAPGNVALTGFVDNVAEIIRQQDVVIGAGRVALEAMQLGVPVIAVGERGYVGPVNDDTIAVARATNFGDCNFEVNSDDVTARLRADLDALLNGEKTIDVARYPAYLEEYDGEVIHNKVMDIYRHAELDAYLSRFREIPVLVYHRVVESPPNNSLFKVYITRQVLAHQLQTLKDKGYTTVTFSDLLNGVRAKKPVILTFDDGYEDNYDNLLPLLEQHGCKAVVYALADRGLTVNQWDVDKGEPPARLMSDAQLRACHESGHIEIGSHGLHHQRLPTVDSTTLRQEVFQSRQILEDVLGAAVPTFAYPYGDYGDREVQAVRAAGYRFGIGTVNGPLRFADDLFRIRRIPIFYNTSPWMFWKKTSGLYLRYCKLKGKNF
jgi:peptidoglycan/xylan/chitin deacetylase (PgdA/CDA1 family)